MAERTLNDPLSGLEMKEIITSVIRRGLDGDTVLRDDMAYGGFRLDFDIRVTILKPATPITLTTLVWGKESQSQEGVESMGEIKLSASESITAPDSARQEFDLPIPVMVNTPSGPKRQRVRIEKK